MGKPPQKGAASNSCLCTVAGLRLGRLQVPSRFLARSAVRLDIVGYLLALGQATQPSALERAGMDEDVLAAAVRLNKAVTFGCVVPFDGACCHNVLLTPVVDETHVVSIGACRCLGESV